MGDSVSDQLIDAFNANDLDRVEDLAADDFELLDVATGETFRGKEGARRNAEGWFRPFPEVKVEMLNVIKSGDWEVMEAVGRGKHTGPIVTPEGEIPATGRTLDLRFVSIIRVRDGKIVEGRDYYDVASLMDQLGLTPEAMATSTG